MAAYKHSSITEPKTDGQDEAGSNNGNRARDEIDWPRGSKRVDINLLQDIRHQCVDLWHQTK